MFDTLLQHRESGVIAIFCGGWDHPPMQRTTVENAPITLGPLGLKDGVKGIKLVARTFAHMGSEKEIVRALHLVDENLSLALRRNGELVGVYLVRKSNLSTLYDGNFVTPHYDGFEGLSVESLAILPSLRGQGYGRLLRAALLPWQNAEGSISFGVPR